MTKLGELGEVNRGRSRHRPRDASHLYGGPYPFIQTGDIKNSGGRITSFTQTYSEDGLIQSRLWPAQTMCITIAANIAETALLSFPACFPDSVVGFIADENKCDVRFIEYVFRRLRQRIQSEATGSVQDNINLQTLARLSFAIPPLREQVAIADVLGAFDDRIDLLRQTNATLEAIAQILFKSWFIDFDPVHVKAEGREPEAMDAVTAALFPSEFEDSELGQIPKGWRAGQFANGLTETSDRVKERAAIVMSAVQTGNLVKSDDHFNKRVHSADISKYKLVPQLSFAYNPSRINIGSIGLNESDGFGAVSPIYVVAKPCSNDFVYLIWHHLREGRTKSAIETLCSGSVRQSLSAKDFMSLPLVLPDSGTLTRFMDIRRALYQKVIAGSERIASLVDLRDTLLPRLISGKLRLPEATEAAEAALA